MKIANNVLTVPFVANEFNLKGISIETAKIASDKLLMKKTLKRIM
tara:strand:- start:302 stop:436 length:135 start_codon:yes stop_codon:yes gene_type:complete